MPVCEAYLCDAFQMSVCEAYHYDAFQVPVCEAYLCDAFQNLRLVHRVLPQLMPQQLLDAVNELDIVLGQQTQIVLAGARGQRHRIHRGKGRQHSTGKGQGTATQHGRVTQAKTQERKRAQPST